jgi:hypothetical protein
MRLTKKQGYTRDLTASFEDYKEWPRKKKKALLRKYQKNPMIYYGWNIRIFEGKN